MADPEGVPWVPWNPYFEGLPSKNTMRKRSTYTTLATQFGFNGSNNARVSTPVSRIRRAHGLSARKYQKHVEIMHVETTSELKLAHALFPLQLGMAICNQYENAYFPVPYADNYITSCFAASATRSCFMRLSCL